MFCFTIFITTIFSLSAQNESPGALLNLGFNAKLLNLTSEAPQISIPIDEQVRKSPRSLSDILNKESKNAEVKTHYYLVAGCFSKSENAKILLAELQIKGYNASIVEDNSDLLMVTYDNYNSYQLAVKALKSLKQKGVDCWLKQSTNSSN